MIELKGISKAYDNKILYKGLDLKINDGEFVVFSGKSGCGKTTLLNIIGGLEKPDAGEVWVDSKNIYTTKNKLKYYQTKVGFLFQNFALVEKKSVEENLDLVYTKSRNNVSFKEALEEVGLLDKINTKVYKLSGGEQQRVALARLMIKKCDIILADEPTGSLDKENADEVMRIIKEMNKKGKTIIMVTHSDEYKSLADRVIKL